MEGYQVQHITLAQPTLAKIIATRNWLISEIEKKSKLTKEESNHLATCDNNLDKTKYIIEVLKRRSHGYKILLTTLLQTLCIEGLIVLQDSFSALILQNLQLDVSGKKPYLSNIFSSKQIEMLSNYMKTKVRPTEFTRLLLKLTGERTLLLCTEDSRNDNAEDISTKIEMIKSLLKLDTSLIHKKDSYGRTPLLTKQCHLDILKYLIKKGADIYQTDDDGYTLVHSCAGWMSPDVFHELVKFLLVNCNAGELFQLKDSMGNTSLHFALSYLPSMRVDTVKLILQQTKINVNDTNRYGENLLYRAFLGGQNADVLKNLFYSGADYTITKPNPQNDFGGWGNAEAFLYFLRIGVDVFE